MHLVLSKWRLRSLGAGRTARGSLWACQHAALVGRDFENSIGTIEVGQTNRYCVSCSAQSDTSTETGDSGADDDDFHFSVLIELVLRFESMLPSSGVVFLICANDLTDIRQSSGQLYNNDTRWQGCICLIGKPGPISLLLSFGLFIAVELGVQSLGDLRASIPMRLVLLTPPPYIEDGIARPAPPEGLRKEVTHDEPFGQMEEGTGDVFLTPPASNEGGTVNTVPIREVQELVSDDFNNDWNSLETQQQSAEGGPSSVGPESSRSGEHEDITHESPAELGGVQVSIIVAISDEEIPTPPTVTKRRTRKPRDTSQGISTDNIVTERRTRQSTEKGKQSYDPFTRKRKGNGLVNAILSRATQYRLHQSELPVAPKSYWEAMKSHYKDEWSEAVHTELNKLLTMETYTLVPLRELEDWPQLELLTLKWVFDYKFDEKEYFDPVQGEICGPRRPTVTIRPQHLRSYAISINFLHPMHDLLCGRLGNTAIRCRERIH